MIRKIRTDFGPILMTGIFAIIILVFVFSGVFSQKSTRGLHDSAVAGTVNGEPITIPEFNRSYTQRVEFFKQMMGGKVSDEQLKSFRLKQVVFNDLVNRKLKGQAAVQSDMSASDEEVKERITEIPAFKKGDKFDPGTYKEVLQAQGYSAAGFERLMREDLSVQQWDRYFKDRVHVSDEELKKEFVLANDKRSVKYVLLTTESGSKGVKVDPVEVQKFLADKSKENLAKSQYDQRKESEYKGKTFEVVKNQIATDLIATGKGEEIRKLNDQLATQVAGLLSADKSGDAKVNNLLKAYKVEVKTSADVSRANDSIQGVGEIKDLINDAFAKTSPINPSQGGKAKVYHSPAGTVVALVSDVKAPDFSKYEAEASTLRSKLVQQKERDLSDTWLKSLTAKAKIERNDAVLSDAVEDNG